MKVEHYTDTPAEPAESAPGVTVRWVIGKKDGAPNFAMRVFVLAGEGAVRREDGESPVGQGTVVFVPGMEMHQFINRGSSVLRFICVVPI
jgi:quercetin dioxygenase-like cupin family protein